MKKIKSCGVFFFFANRILLILNSMMFSVYKYSLILCQKEYHSRCHKKINSIINPKFWKTIHSRQNSKDGLPRFPSHIYSSKQ